MGAQSERNEGPDLTQGVAAEAIREGQILEGQVDGETVILARKGEEIFAVSGTCTHYSGPLAKGLVVGETVRCPWHHACFSLRTGEALGAPAFDPIQCWNIEQRDGKVFITGKAGKAPAPVTTAEAAAHPESIVIIGGGAAGFAATEMLRRHNYAGKLTVLSSDDDAPYDRPNLSKDFLAGEAPAEWIPLRSKRFYEKRDIDLRLGATVERIDPAARTVTLADGTSLPFERLLIAAGAEPVLLPIPGADGDNVFTLRSWADSRAIIDRAQASKVAVVIGASFIGLETAAALRTRGLEVHVVAPEALPLEKVLGPELGKFIRALHEDKGVTFHLENTVESIGKDAVRLKDGAELKADLIVTGVGVKPRISLARDAGLAIGSGIKVDAFLESSVQGIFAAGDVAEWQSSSSAEPRRVEHWVVAERQGQVAALNMLGARQPFTDTPFFWSAHYDTSIRYVGYAGGWDSVEVDGDIKAGDAALRYKVKGRTVAVATLGRDQEALRAGEELRNA